MYKNIETRQQILMLIDRIGNSTKNKQNPESFRSRVFYPYINLIKTRKKQPAFHPKAAFEILEIDPRIFAIKRHVEDQTVYALTNISAAEISLSLSEKVTSGRMADLITGETANTDLFTLKPYQYVWLTENDSNKLRKERT